MINKLLFLLSLTSLCFPAFAQVSGFTKVSDPVAIQKKVAAKASDITSIQSDFIQEKHLSVLSQPITSKGNFTYKKENKLRWEYTTPFTYLVILNNGKILMKDENKESKFDMGSSKMFQEINNLIVNSVQGKISESKDFNVTYFQDPDYYLVVMEPLSGEVKEFFSAIYIYFEKKSLSVGKIDMKEASGDNTLIKFLNHRYNAAIPDEKFSIR